MEDKMPNLTVTGQVVSTEITGFGPASQMLLFTIRPANAPDVGLNLTSNYTAPTFTVMSAMVVSAYYTGLPLEVAYQTDGLNPGLPYAITAATSLSS